MVIKNKAAENKAAEKPTGRSAAANGLRDITERANEKNNRQQVPVVKTFVPAEQQSTFARDIDAPDRGNVQAVTEYVRDVYTFLRRDEVRVL